MKKTQAVIISILSFLILAVILVYAFIFVQTRPVDSKDTESIRIEIPSGTTVNQVANTLEKNKIIKNARLFYLSVRFPLINSFLFFNEKVPEHFILKSGIYRLNKSMDFSEIQTELISGQQEYIVISIPEGLTISKIAALLEANKICRASDFISVAKDNTQDIFKKYSIRAETLEGFLFPDTYYLTSGMKAYDVASMMVENFFTRIKEIPELAAKSADDLYQTLILASIVEREYRIPEEAPLIASVFKNRIKQNIGLYSCATVEYIITEIEGKPHPDRILLDDLKIDSPYNTYKWAGLTPGPISNPGLIALNAATNTPKTDYYFFQIVDPAAGKHVFSKTFEQHKVNHNLYTKN